MADSDISLKTIQLEMESDSSKAEESIDKLAKSLLGLSNALGKVGKNAGNVSSLLKSLSDVNKFRFDGLTNAINQLTELSKIKLNGLKSKNIEFKVEGIEKIDVEKITNLSNEMSKLSYSITALKASTKGGNGLASLASSLKKMGSNDILATLHLLPHITASLNDFFNGLAQLPQISDNTVRLVEAFTKLGKSARNVASAEKEQIEQERLLDRTQTAARQSAQRLVDDMGKLANVIKKSLVSGIKAFVNAVKKLGSAVGTISQKIGSAMVSLGKAGASGIKNLISSVQSIGTQGVSGLRGFVAQIGSLRKQTSSVTALTMSLKNLFGVVIGFRGIYGVFNWLKEAVNSGAAVAEVNHIVNSTYRDLSGELNTWAREAMNKYGIAETAAKKYAGTMSAMFQASGIAYKDAAKMSTDMVGLAGDLASFYNIDTETAYNKIRSGLAGMVRPLRDVGIDLSVATLKEYALAQGITKSWQSMSQAEKVMLRYKYLLEVTTNQQGDFQATAASMANSLRTLRAYGQAITETIGDALASALRHVIHYLILGAKAVLTMASAFRVFMQTLFGKNISGATLNLTDGLEDASGYADDLDDSTGNASDGLGDAADNARKLKKDLSVLPFDELNQLNKDKEETGSSSGTGGTGIGDISGLEDLTDGLFDSALGAFNDSLLPDAISAWAERIRKAFESQDWVLLGQEIASGINDGIQKLYDILDPQTIKEKVDPWIEAFTTTFNSLVDSLDFEMMGRTIGRGINDLVYILNKTIEGINWVNLGRQLANGVNGIIRELNFSELGRLFANKLNMIWQTAYGFVSNFAWDELGQKFAEGAWSFISYLDIPTMVETINTGLVGIADTVYNFANDFPWADAGNVLANGVNAFIDGFPADEIGEAVGTLCDGILTTIENLVNPETGINFANLGMKLASGFRTMISKGINPTRLGTVIANLWNGAWTFLNNFIDGLKSDSGEGTFIGDTIKNTLETIVSEIEFGDTSEALSKFVNNLVGDIKKIFGKTETWAELGTKIGEGIANVLTHIDAEGLAEAINSVGDALSVFISSAITALWNHHSEIANNFKLFFEKLDWADLFAALGLFVAPIMAAGIGNWFLKDVVKTVVKNKLVSMLGGVLTTGLGEAAADEAVVGAAQGLGTAIGGAIVEAAGLVAAAAGITAGFIEIGEAAKGAYEILKGGNGFDTIGGAAIQRYIDKLRALNDVSRETGDQLFSLKESWESGEIDDTSFFSRFAEILQEGGINAVQAKAFLELLKGEVELTDEQMEILNNAIAGMTEETSNAESVVSQFATDSETSGLKMAYAFARASDEMKKLGDEDTSRRLAEAQTALMELTAGGTDAQTAFQQVCEQFGFTEEASNKLKLALEIEFGEGAFEYLLGESQSTAESLEEVGTAAETASDHLGELGTESETAGTSLDTAFSDVSGIFADFDGGIATVIGAMEQLGLQPEEIKRKIDSYLGAGAYDNFINSTSNAANQAGTLTDAIEGIGGASETSDEKTTSLSNILDFSSLSALAALKMGVIALCLGAIGTASKNADKKTGEFQESLDGYDTSSATEELGGLNTAFSETGESADGAKTAILDSMSEANTEMVPKVTDIVNTVKGMGDDLKTEGETAGGNIIGGLTGGIENNLQSLIDSAGAAADTIPSTMTDSSHLDMNSPSKVMEDIGENVTLGLANGITGAEESLTTAITTLVNNFKDNTGNLFSSLGETFSGYGSDLVGSFTTGVDNAFANFSVAGFVTDIANSFTNAINDNYWSLYAAGQSMGTALANGISSIHIPVPWLGVNYWDTYYNSDGSWYTVPRYSVSWYAKGGLFTNPTIAGFGEAGDEAALPLENKNVMRRIADAIVDNSGGGMGMTSEQMTSAVARGMVQAMMSNSANQNQIFNITVKTESDETLARAVIRGMDAIDYRTNGAARLAY